MAAAAEAVYEATPATDEAPTAESRPEANRRLGEADAGSGESGESDAEDESSVEDAPGESGAVDAPDLGHGGLMPLCGGCGRTMQLETAGLGDFCDLCGDDFDDAVPVWSCDDCETAMCGACGRHAALATLGGATSGHAAGGDDAGSDEVKCNLDECDNLGD